MVNFKSLLDKATATELSEPDWESILEIVEEIKTKSVSVKNAMKEFRRKLQDSDGNVVYHTLCALDSVMKNCASDLHSEVLSTDFMGVMKEMISSSKDGKRARAVDKALELIGEWKAAFGQHSDYKAVNEAFSDLEMAGYHIPQAQVASAAFIQKAPDWKLDSKCALCRQEFNKLKGYWRHHCRNCGKSVCSSCSSKRLALPHYGLEQPTKVCDICFKKLDKGEGKSEDEGKGKGKDDDSDLPLEYLQSSLAQESQKPPTQAEESKLQEEDDLQLAIAMSLNEQENKKKSSKFSPSPSPTPPMSSAPSAPPPPIVYATIAHDTSRTANASTTIHDHTENEDPNLARYLDRSYWERRKEEQHSSASSSAKPSEATPAPTATVAASDIGPSVVALPNGTTTTPLAETIKKTLEQFIQRMQEVTAAGKSVATDAVVLSMYQSLNAMQPQLLTQIDEIQQKKAHQEGILHKLNEAKEARVSLNSMRRQHQERIKQQEQEQAILARMQMETKLALLRQQKQEQLEYQQSLQMKRIEALSNQRSEYERQLQTQRELERQQLIAQEQQVLQHHFGSIPQSVPLVAKQQPPAQPGQTSPYGTSPVQQRANPLIQYQPTGATLNPSSLPVQNLTLHDPTLVQQAGPLPTKLDHIPSSISAPPPPPPYHPEETDGLYQPPSFQPSTSIPQQPLGTLFVSQPSTQLPSLNPPPSSFAMPPQAIPSMHSALLSDQPMSGLQSLPQQQPQSFQQQPQSLLQQPSLPQQPRSLPQQPPQQPQSLPQQPQSLPQQPQSLPQHPHHQQPPQSYVPPHDQLQPSMVGGYAPQHHPPTQPVNPLPPTQQINPLQPQQSGFGGVASQPTTGGYVGGERGGGGGGMGVNDYQQQSYQHPSQPLLSGHQQPAMGMMGGPGPGLHISPAPTPVSGQMTRQQSEPPLISFD